MSKTFLLSIFLGLTFMSRTQSEWFSELSVDTTFQTEGFEFLDDYVTDKRAVFTGENHRYVSTNQIVKLKMLMYLYTKGFRYLVLELGQGIGYLANDYVTTGNERSLSALNLGMTDDKNPMFELLSALRRFNLDKQPDEMIKVVGADFTRYPFYSTRAMANIIEDLGCEKELDSYYEDLVVLSSARDDIDRLGFSTRGRRVAEDFDIKSSFKTYRNRIFELSIRNLVQDFYRDTLSFQLALGEKYHDFKFILDEINETLQWYKGEGLSVQTHIRRERHLEKRILLIFEQDPSAKVFGQFGRCHLRMEDFTQECYAFDMQSVAERLNKHDQLAGKISVLPIYYLSNNEFKLNKSASASDQVLTERGKLFIYNTAAELVTINTDSIHPPLVFLNTFSSFVTMEDILEDKGDMKFKNKRNQYRNRFTEDHIMFSSSLADFGGGLNEDFGVDFYPKAHHFFAFGLRSIASNGFQGTFRVGGIQPTRNVSDSLSLRYSNWNFQLGPGYNFIHTKRFSMYTDLLFSFGFSKIREQRIPAFSPFTFPTLLEEANYRNRYFGLLGDLGFSLKFDNGLATFVEAGYQYDITNPLWQNRGIEVPGISATRFSGFVLKAGISFFIKERAE